MNPSSPDLFEPLERDTLADKTTLERLAVLCAQELGAAQTYQQALTVADVSQHAGVLSRCYASHRSRAGALVQRVAAFEGLVPKSPGTWSPLRAILSTPVPVANERLVIGLLDDAEEAWSREYRDEVPRMSASDREFVNHRVLPAQDATRGALAELKHRIFHLRSV